jgi:GTP-binding protein Era
VNASDPAAAPPQGPTRCGYAAVLGAPNVGKSTLVNRIVGTKVSIVSPKVQTTRTRVLGIRMAEAAQIILVDTPGIFRPRRRLDRAMVAAAWGAADADAILLLVDSTRGIDDDTRGIVERLREQGRKAVLVLNKVDVVEKPALLQLAGLLAGDGLFTDTFMISAETGDGVEDLVRFLAARMPEGPWLYPEDQISDMPQRLLAAEVTREQIYLQLHQELPYAATVETESWEERDDGSAAIRQVVYVQKPGQKGIVLGKGGTRIKAIGSAARGELEKLLERRIHLMLFVKVREKWAEDPERFRTWDLDFNA